MTSHRAPACVTALLTVMVLVLGTATAQLRSECEADCSASAAKAALALDLADKRLLETAAGAARWIDASAVRSPRGVVWPADPADPKSVATT